MNNMGKNKGLYKQMQDSEDNETLCNNLSLETLIDYCLELSKGKDDDDKRKFIMDTDKGGVIEYYKAMYNHLNKTDEEILRIEKELKEALKEGMYRIDDNGVTYLGKYE